ncbi:BTB/POZ domain-containing adapter for CUL3-mediated RhoA degradation protein 3-like [Panonychus citri]|uniref:BTB/POZ domain-containing adapter for CUL3-mediated RhoA degradation protein 3-like n=1 Tax=Panonychus citri TaxID=50023 RepID=UPI0023078D4C|nr:BTB/POZ domain-containing adapter for CUL3-mediated RhoA degradation protein 3-like [Panonychus citri]
MSESNDKNESELPTEALTPVENEQSEFVKLNVGGFLFQTTMATLTKVDCMFKGMFSEGFEAQKDPEGWILIDRDGKHFGKILEFLRNMEITLPDNVKEIRELLTEAIYYSIKAVVHDCESKLKRLKKGAQIVFTTSIENAPMAGSVFPFKPEVRLTIIHPGTSSSRYSGQSIENLCKNYQLFDNLCLRSNGQIGLVKSVSKDQPICTWSFLGYNGSPREVSCIRIVNSYPQVDFPEGQIYENVLQLLAND